MDPIIKGAIPVLPAADTTESLSWWTETCGFKETFRDGTPPNHAGINRGDLDRSLNSELWGLGMGVRMFPKHNGNLLLRWVQETPGGLSPGEGESTV